MITAVRFLDAWKTATAPRSQLLLDNWDEPGKYTAHILGDNGVLSDVAATLGLLCYTRGYYHTDAILYDDDDFIPERKTNEYWFRGIKVAFEHENKFNKNLYQEIGHLLLLSTSLSVIVTYPRRGSKLNMDYFHSIIKNSSRAEELDLKENFLLIFGYADPLEWEGMVFKSVCWKSINYQVSQTSEVAN